MRRWPSSTTRSLHLERVTDEDGEGRFVVMLTVETLETAGTGFASVLAQVTDDQWSAPTGNEGRTVRQLVDHVVDGNRMASVILGGGTREEGLAVFGGAAGEADIVAAFAVTNQDVLTAFAQPGALERVVAHPAIDMLGAQLLGFRTGEYGLHGWDLARAIGADDAIDQSVLESLWAMLVAMAPMLVASGMFGTGSSGTVPDDAPLQLRVLDISGRRP